MSAEKGWIGEPQPPCRDYIPGEEHKWRLMMGNGQFLTDEQKAALAEMKAKTIPEDAQQRTAEHEGNDDR